MADPVAITPRVEDDSGGGIGGFFAGDGEADGWRSDDGGSSMTGGGQLSATGVPQFVINLDDDPSERWNEVVDYFRTEFKAVEQMVETVLEEELHWSARTLGGVVERVLTAANHLGAVFYGKELKGMADRLGMPLGRLTALQLMYEACSACTSVVVEDADGVPHHIRNMDWELDWLLPLTVELEFQTGGERVFSATSWAGYVGVLTGVKEGVISASVNFRLTPNGTGMQNFWKTMGRAWPVGFLLREVLTDATSFEEARAGLAESPLIAPVYYTVAGLVTGESGIITRERDNEVVPITCGDNEGLVFQTNQDHWDDSDEFDVGNSQERRNTAARGMRRLQRSEVTREGLWEVMSTGPVFNELTVYGTYMCPTTGEIETRIPHPLLGFIPLEDPVPLHGEAKEVCTACSRSFLPSLNPRGQCAHVGEWHATFGDCSYIKCSVGLGLARVGQQHWSCCYNTRRNSPCRKSGQHHVPGN